MELPPVQWIKRINQKSIRIRVKYDAIIVSAPIYVSEKEMKRFFNEKHDWVKTSYAGLVTKKTKTDALNRFQLKEILYFGSWVPFILKTGEIKNAISVKDGVVFINTSAEQPDENDISLIYAKYSQGPLSKSFTEVAETLGFRYKRLTFRNQKSKWGSCSANGNINLNWRLIKCPPFVQRYIFIHELCHLTHLNHSDKFWNLVEFHMPNYKEAEQWIKLNGALVFQDP